MYKLNFEKRVWIVKQKIKGTSPYKIAIAQGISESMVRRIFRIYPSYGWDGLKDHKTGRPETLLNGNAEIIILDLRKRFGYGACRIKHLLKGKGFDISHRQIKKLLLRTGLIEPNIKKQKPRKGVRYGLPNPNDLWHTDWSYNPFTDKNLSVYIDDRTRLVTSYAIFKNATADNSIALLKTGMSETLRGKTVGMQARHFYMKCFTHNLLLRCC